MDDADRADLLNAFYLEAQIRQARGARERGPASQAGPGPRLCAECGEEIPQARIEAVPDCRLCTKCQQELEGKER
ncbi:MAG: TraR/DksA C4-type zinc finger protein [Desulfobacteraceae bacterium]|jgi:phage/conjugal plasmid C-4 type zinc finger TraR family protein